MKKYQKLTLQTISLNPEEGFFTASIETKDKDFNVTTGNYEVFTENWYSNNPTFDNPSF